MHKHPDTHAQAHTETYTCTGTQTHMHRLAQTHTHMHRYTRMHTCTGSHTDTHTHICTGTQAQSTGSHMLTCSLPLSPGPLEKDRSSEAITAKIYRATQNHFSLRQGLNMQFWLAENSWSSPGWPSERCPLHLSKLVFIILTAHQVSPKLLQCGVHHSSSRS